MTLNLGQLATSMFNAAFPILKHDAPEIANFARGEFQKLAQQIITIEEELETHQITEEQARILIDMQKSAARVVLLTAKGLSLLTVEKALNAALDVVRTALNAATGLAIL
jgi:hypothetical protein